MTDRLDDALAELTAVYQPVVQLETGQVLGYEALARGSGAGGLECPEAMLAAAREVGRSAEVDWRCRDVALRGALAAQMGGTLTLFVNVEPDTAAEIPHAFADRVAEAESALRVVLEVTERAVVHQPAELLRLVDWARDRSWGIALDDIGEDPSSLAMMPFLEPDVIKLDLRLVQERPSAEIGLIMSAVLAQAERTGAQVVAEGVEDDAMQEAALALGATLGQGWLYGRPGPLPDVLPRCDDVVPLKRTWAGLSDATPFGLVRAALPLRHGTKAQLLGIASHLEEQAMAWSDGPVVRPLHVLRRGGDRCGHDGEVRRAGRSRLVRRRAAGGAAAGRCRRCAPRELPARASARRRVVGRRCRAALRRSAGRASRRPVGR